jgi:hypothetical protein
MRGNDLAMDTPQVLLEHYLKQLGCREISQKAPGRRYTASQGSISPGTTRSIG